MPDEDAIDRGLLEATRVDMFASRCGIELQPWQRRVLDGAMVAKELDEPIVLRLPRRRR